MRSPAAIEQLVTAVLKGQRRALAQAITLIESSRADHQKNAENLLQQLLAHNGSNNRALRIGISGVPGVGKSTFIEALGLYLIGQGQKVAVLSIDPSSSISGGSILGDKTRMENLARNAQAFIRPSPAGRTLGGVARRTRETILLCEAAGFDTVIVETVGVGQSETLAAEMTDMFILLLLPSAGDELQGIKRGIMELADLIVINKADGELIPAAQRAAADYRNALRLLQTRSIHWQVPVVLCSALMGHGVDDVWQKVKAYRQALDEHGEIDARRAQQAKAWLWQETNERLLELLKSHPKVRQQISTLEKKVQQGQSLAPAAARQLIQYFLANH